MKQKRIYRNKSIPISLNPFALLKEENEDEIDSDTESVKMIKIRENKLTNIIKEFKIKEELHDIKVIII